MVALGGVPFDGLFTREESGSMNGAALMEELLPQLPIEAIEDRRWLYRKSHLA